MGLRGLAGGQNTSLLVLTRALAFPGLPLTNPAGSPAPQSHDWATSAQPRALGVWPAALSRCLSGCADRRPPGHYRAAGPEAGLTSGGAGFVNSRAGSRRPRRP